MLHPCPFKFLKMSIHAPRCRLLDVLGDGIERDSIRVISDEAPNGADIGLFKKLVEETTPGRVNAHLEELEGTWVEHDPETGRYYLADTDLSEPERRNRWDGR